MDINQIRALSNDDMQAVNHLIQQQVDSDVALINQLGFYIVNSGGKRLRPLLTVLSARAMGIENADHHTSPLLLNLYIPPPCCTTMW